MQPTSLAHTARRLILIAVSLGLLYGMIEGLESFGLSLLPAGLSWSNGNSVEAMMFMPVFYLVAYLAIGLLLLPFALLIRRPWWDQVLLFLLVLLSAYLAARNQQAVFNKFASAVLGLGIATVVLRSYRKRPERWNRVLVGGCPWIVATAILLIAGSFVGLRISESRKLSRLAAADRAAPNVLLIVLDTDRADHMSAYGYHRPTTPSLESLAREGTLFEQAYSPSSWTLPSHASMFTGRMKHQLEQSGRELRRLGTRYPTLAERFQAHGYATAGFVANIWWASRQSGLNRGFIRYEDFYGTLGDALQRTAMFRNFQFLSQWFSDGSDINGRKHASIVNREFLSWTGRNKDRPWFAFLNFMDVHAPYLPPAPFAGKFGPLRPEFEAKRFDIGWWKELNFDPDHMANRTDRYDESQAYLDSELGKLFEELRRRGQLDNTVVVVTADHGEHLGEHQIVAHGASLYSEEIHVPLILRFPGKVPAGVRVPQAVSTTNIAATILSLASVADTQLPGRSLLLGVDEAGPQLQPVVSEMSKAGGKDPPEWPGSKGWVRSLVADRWHFIVLENGERSLFDIDRDPLELTNLAGTPEGSPVAQTLLDRLSAIVPAR
ncbi:MAG: sulfatase [Gemmatimonadota bacterium]